MLRALFSVAASLALLITLSAATNKVTLQHRVHHAKPVVSEEMPNWPRCHTASCRDAFAPDSLQAGYLDPSMALPAQFANKVFKSQ